MGRVGESHFTQPPLPQDATSFQKVQASLEEEALFQEKEKTLEDDFVLLASDSSAGMASFFELAKTIEVQLADQLDEPLAEVGQEFVSLASTVSSSVSTFVPLEPVIDSKLQYVSFGLSIFQASTYALGYHARKLELHDKKAELAKYEKLYELFPDKQELKDRVEALRDEVESAEKQVKDLFAYSAFNFISLGLWGAESAASSIASLVESIPVSQALSATGRVVGVVGNAFWIGLISKDIHQTRKRLEKLEVVTKEVVEKHLATAQAGTLKHSIVQLRLANLRKQQEENRVYLVSYAISLASTIVSTIVASKFLLVAVGISLSALVGAAASAMSVAAVVLGGVALVVGMGYVIYKRREAIEHAFHQLQHFTVDKWQSLNVKMLNDQKKSLEVRHEQAEKRAEAIPEKQRQYAQARLEIQEKINELSHERDLLGEKEKSTGFIKQIGYYLHHILLDLELYICKQREQHLLERDEKVLQRRSYSVLTKEQLNTTAQKADRVRVDMMRLAERRAKLDDGYKIRQHLASFGGATVKEFEMLQDLRAQIEQTSDVELDFMGVKKNATGEEKWDAFIAYATATVSHE
jgi:hypothetical protein